MTAFYLLKYVQSEMYQNFYNELSFHYKLERPKTEIVMVEFWIFELILFQISFVIYHCLRECNKTLV